MWRCVCVGGDTVGSVLHDKMTRQVGVMTHKTHNAASTYRAVRGRGRGGRNLVAAPPDSMLASNGGSLVCSQIV